MQFFLIIINDAPYGSEKAYNALRMAMTLQLMEDAENDVTVFLLADAVNCAMPNQQTPNGDYNIESMIKSVVNNNGKVKICGACAVARGIRELKMIEGAEFSNMLEFAELTVECDKVLTF